MSASPYDRTAGTGYYIDGRNGATQVTREGYLRASGIDPDDVHDVPQELRHFEVVVALIIGERALSVQSRNTFIVRATDRNGAYWQGNDFAGRLVNAFGPTDPADTPLSVAVNVRPLPVSSGA